jgi:hypothetical protein
MSIGAQTQAGNAGEKKSYEPLSPGTYEVALDRVNDKTSSKGSVDKDLTFKVASGEHEGRLIFNTRFFEKCANPVAVDISNRDADKLFKALGAGGLEKVGDDLSAFNDYIGTRVVAKIDIEYPEGYKPRNVIKSFQRR